jgi:hypothetical protein
MHERLSAVMFKLLLLAGIILQSGCSTAVFHFDRAALPDAKPWTSENFQNNPDNFQFAVIGDRTGGADHRGVFDRAMDQLNLLQPEFVINVGDLIEGYTQDRAKLTAEWDEVEGMIEKLEMPFIYTVGNHDLNNDTMKRVWLERRGADYYHFVYREVLFLVLNSEDPPNAAPEGIEESIELYNKLQVEDPERAQAMLDEFMATVEESFRVPANFSDQQVAYIKKALAQNADVRWTFAFLHQPAWENPSESFLAIEQLLEDRDYTFIAGHLHYYDIDERFGRDYITMGPAGASFHHEGPGNVDHILWVTMNEDGPRIAKITLDGIYDRRGRDLELKGLYERKGKQQ